jgi:hypothetical protein
MVKETKDLINFPKVCGVLVEPRRLDNIVILINNFQKVMPARHLFFFCGSKTINYYKELYKNDNLITLIDLKVDNLTAKEHNNLWKTLSFWENFKDFTHILTIQTDGCLCENSEYKIEDFYKYDYVGGYTPYKWWWKETKGLHRYSDYQCFNGGFSFRKIQSMIDVLNEYPPLPTEDFYDGLCFRAYGEDLYFVVGLLTLNNNCVSKKYVVGLDELATKFCTHTHYLHKTFCVHKYDNYVTSGDIISFLNYCPTFFNFIEKKNKNDLK